MKKVIGLDLGDKQHVAVVFEPDGQESLSARVGNTALQLEKFFGRHEGAVVVMEAGTHSPWISRLLEKLGHEVHVGNPRKLRAIWDADDKSDERDARILGLMYRMEPRLLHRIHHRGEEAQMDLERIKARDVLVGARTRLVNHVRAAIKSTGQRIPSCSAPSFHKRARECMPAVLESALQPVLVILESLTDQIRALEREIEQLCEQKYSETKLLKQVVGVGSLTSLAYVLTIEDPCRFESSRRVGSYLGLVPRRDQSGAQDKQLRITKAGDVYLRKLLVNSAQYIMGPFGPDTDLRRYGERIAARGGKNAKKRAVVAVARKLAVLLHRLWQDQSVYVPVAYKRAA